MKLMEFDPNSFSKDSFLIGGINTYIYNLAKLSPVLGFEQPNEVNVLYLIHEREGSYKFTESVAYTVLDQYYSERQEKRATNNVKDLICVTFDVRNHGERVIDANKNLGWSEGNLTHALDMLSFIDGAVQDLKLIIDYLPSYLESNEIKIDSFKLINYITGYSLGGHATIRFASNYPHLVEGIIPVVGCSDLSSLLINRLKQIDVTSNELGLKLFNQKYQELKLSTEQKILYPHAFHDYLSLQDKEIFENFRFDLIKMYAIFGAKDTLVPPLFSQQWLDRYKEVGVENCQIFTQPDAGHETTSKMIITYTDWLINI